ncbi:peptidase inhibitor family I36 protein [Streptomyces sp. AM6-12]|uniref:peptidase inhibitor family I36 protein n=1 Tax=Streptomyces sp. AM6-12 TaxID=3345149 RepID=UPI00378836FA
MLDERLARLAAVVSHRPDTDRKIFPVKRPTAVLAAALLAAGALATAPTPASATSATSAGDCPAGSFCVWTGPDFTGQRVVFSGDDAEWEDNVSRQDASWANRALSGPGVKDHVAVYSGPDYTGSITLCLEPGQEISGNRSAAGRGVSSRWTMSCRPTSDHATPGRSRYVALGGPTDIRRVK